MAPFDAWTHTIGTRPVPSPKRPEDFALDDPRNLSRVWVPIPGRDEYLPVPYADLRRPPISQYEQEAALREIKSTGRKSGNEDAIFATIELQRKLIDRARKRTRARRLHERRPTDLTPRQAPSATSDALTPVDYTKPAKPFPGETWRD
jgi:putative transposase